LALQETVQYYYLLQTVSQVPTPSPKKISDTKTELQGTSTIDYCDWSADETIAAIKNKSVTAREYISSVLNRAEKTESLNAFINLLPDYALSTADKVDSAIAAGNPPPLAGLAIVVKDNINLAGFPTTAGTAALQHHRPSTTAPSLEKLIAAGAIVIGKTNLHELSLGVTSTNLQPFANPVRNPYDRNRTVGGSSGGTAVAIASRVVTCGLGTDTGGSLRIPAALTGIVGFRPSVGNGGIERRYHDSDTVVPLSSTRDTVGPMGRSVSEISLLSSIITGQPRVIATELRGLRFGVPPVLWSGLDEEVNRISAEARMKLLKAGVILVDDDIPNLLSFDKAVGGIIVSHEAKSAIPAYLAASNISNVSLRDIYDGIASPDVKAVFKTILNCTHEREYREIMTVTRPALQKLYADYFSQKRVDAIMCPTTILPATLIDHTHGSGDISINGGSPVNAFSSYIRNTSPAGSVGIPALSIPVGMTAHGLPVGINFDGPLGRDDRLISIGLAIEKIFGSLPPPNV
ncbi:indoleacetamide hydrolase, partial [Bemisia tabaci]|uniref:indoleacetamide hydrolase n=1 Tax=Bemisia tabaci TaxID=7038 RepID=UPI003B2828A1